MADVDELASAAWRSALATSGQAPSSMAVQAAIFAPFEGFCWMADPPAKWIPDPVGRTPAEAKNVAWLMTCASRIESPRSVRAAASTLGFVTHLEREDTAARILYRRLATCPSALVKVSELEEELHSTMEPTTVVDGGQLQRIDPYFWSMLERTVRESTSQYLETLDITLGRMKGIEPLQHTAQIDAAMQRVRRATSHELSRVLLSRGTSKDVIATLSALQNEFCAQHVAMIKDYMRQQIKWLRALSWLAASDSSNVEQSLSAVEHDLELLLANPPLVFQEHLESRGVSLFELAACYANVSDKQSGLIDLPSSVRPPSSGVRATMVERWLKRNRVLVTEACASCICVFNRLLDQPPSSVCWNGIELLRNDPSDAQTRTVLADKSAHCIDATVVVRHDPPKHLACNGASEGHVLVYTHKDAVIGLRCTRFFSVLIEQATRGLLPPLTIRADVLLPIVSRFTAEHEAQYVRTVEMKLRPIADEVGHRWPGDALVLRRKRHLSHPSHPSHPSNSPVSSRSDSDTAEGAMASGSHTLCAQVVQSGGVEGAALAAVEQATVPPKLLRDHAIVYALCKCIREGLQPFTHVAGYTHRIGLEQVTTMVRAVAPVLSKHTDGSLKQAVSYVIKTVLSRTQSHESSYPQTVEGRFVYVAERDRKAGGQVIGVLMDAKGKVALLKFATWVAMQMSLNGHAYLKEWKPSRSAQSHATTVAKHVREATTAKRAKPVVTVVSAVPTSG